MKIEKKNTFYEMKLEIVNKQLEWCKWIVQTFRLYL